MSSSSTSCSDSDDDHSGPGQESAAEDDSLDGDYLLLVPSTIIHIHNLIIELTEKSGGTIVMAAFGAHFLKEISTTQLLSAAKRLLNVDKKKLQLYEKTDFMVPLGRAFVEKNIVKIAKGARIANLSRGDVDKVGTF